MSKNVTVKDLRNALQGLPDDTTITLCASQYNKAFPHYMVLKFSPLSNTVIEIFSEKNIRLFTSLPETDNTYSFLSIRKK